VKRAVDIFKKISECEEKLSGTPGVKLVERHPKICTLGKYYICFWMVKN
jgi:hypothetical protein